MKSLPNIQICDYTFRHVDSSNLESVPERWFALLLVLKNTNKVYIKLVPRDGKTYLKSVMADVLPKTLEAFGYKAKDFDLYWTDYLDEYLKVRRSNRKVVLQVCVHSQGYEEINKMRTPSDLKSVYVLVHKSTGNYYLLKKTEDNDSSPFSATIRYMNEYGQARHRITNRKLREFVRSQEPLTIDDFKVVTLGSQLFEEQVSKICGDYVLAKGTANCLNGKINSFVNRT